MEWKEFETTFSVKLNQQQKEAVQLSLIHI